MPTSTYAVPVANYIDEIEFPAKLGRLIASEPLFRDTHKVQFSAAWPKQRSDTPSIRYILYRMWPGVDNVETKKPRVREVVKNPDGTLTEYQGQMMTCIYQFDCCAWSSEHADRIVHDLDDMLRVWTGAFQQFGILNMFWEERLQDRELPQVDDIMVRSTRWKVLLNRVTEHQLPSLEEIRLRMFGPAAPVEDYEAVVRSTTKDRDILSTLYVDRILKVADASSSGYALTTDYFYEIDYVVEKNQNTDQTAIAWLNTGKRPTVGSTYYVRFSHYRDWRLVLTGLTT